MRVLIAIDGSAGSFEAVRQVTRLLAPERDTVGLCYSAPGVANKKGAEGAALVAAGEQLAEAVFAQAAEFLPQGWPSGVERILSHEDPRVGILHSAERWQADLVAVGARGLGFVRRLMLGSVSRSVVHAAKLPVFVARQKEAPAPQPAGPHVLLACDGAASGRELGAVLSRFTLPSGTLGHVLRVVPNRLADAMPPWLEHRTRSPELEQLVGLWIKQHAEELRTAQAEMQALAEQLPAPFRAAPPLVEEGTPEKMILRAIEDQQIDLVILGAKASTPLGRLLVGSTCASILNYAPCSVLVIRQGEPTAVG